MEDTQTIIYQVIAKILDGKSRTLNFKTPIIPIISIKTQIQNLTSIPIHQQLLLSNGKTLFDDAVLCHGSTSPATVHLLLRLRGGKGGFGSLLRGAATKAGQKKTNNFDACRDMSGRRLRHVNAEKKMEEWLAEEKERKLEKVAEEFIKKKAKTAKKEGAGGDGAEKYVEKYRKDSAKCMEEVEKSVRESLGGGLLKSKRKVGEMEGDGLKSKKLKIWMGKRKVDDSDSDDMDEDDSDDEMSKDIEKSVVTNSENQSDSNKEANGSVGSVAAKADGESSVGCSSESGSEEEKETVPEGPLDSTSDPNGGSLNVEGVDVNEPDSLISDEKTAQKLDSAALCGEEAVQPEMENINKTNISIVEENFYELPNDSGVQKTVASEIEVLNSDSKGVVDQETGATKGDCPDMEKPLNFDDFSSAAEMEVLGMERLKSELQERGLKCGGTLQERAARLFLLKTTPVEMLPKKLFAKK